MCGPQKGQVPPPRCIGASQAARSKRRSDDGPLFRVQAANRSFLSRRPPPTTVEGQPRLPAQPHRWDIIWHRRLDRTPSISITAAPACHAMSSGRKTPGGSPLHERDNSTCQREHHLPRKLFLPSHKSSYNVPNNATTSTPRHPCPPRSPPLSWTPYSAPRPPLSRSRQRRPPDRPPRR
jgi:hypothetical protein